MTPLQLPPRQQQFRPAGSSSSIMPRILAAAGTVGGVLGVQVGTRSIGTISSCHVLTFSSQKSAVRPSRCCTSNVSTLPQLYFGPAVGFCCWGTPAVGYMLACPSYRSDWTVSGWTDSPALFALVKGF